MDVTIREGLHKKPAIDDFNLLFNKILSSEKLLYFADNAGEIVFDKIFIEEMISVKERPFERISFVIKGGPIINDAMLADARETGIDKLPGVIFHKLGNGEERTGADRRSNKVKEWIREHKLVISKGQANFEGLSENEGICFMFMAKCPVIAGELKVKELDSVIKCQ
mgnify:CR=1 FL=1|jgi:uncharacterized protein with ATP-grasp and redox domains